MIAESGIVLPVSPDVAEDVEVGREYTVTFTNQQQTTLSMTLERVIPPTDGTQALLVLSCDVMPENFTYPRQSQVELTLEEIEGYRIPETALVEEDGKVGVYILDGGRVCLREVWVLRRGEGYVLVYAPTKAQREDGEDDTYHYDRYIALSDVVITSGDDLYDGKYIK